jgi:hypothetical protein
MDEGVLPLDKVEAFHELESSIVPLEGILVCLYHTMQKLLKNAHKEGLQCDHATLFIIITNLGFLKGSN